MMYLHHPVRDTFESSYGATARPPHLDDPGTGEAFLPLLAAQTQDTQRINDYAFETAH